MYSFNEPAFSSALVENSVTPQIAFALGALLNALLTVIEDEVKELINFV